MTISSLFRFTFKKAGAIVALAAIVACSPSYNWRELDVADGHVRAAFPDTVKTETRDTRVDTMTMPVTMASAKVGDGMFAVVSAPLPAEIAASRARAGAGRGGDAVAVPESAGAAAAGVSALWPGHRDTGPERRPTFLDAGARLGDRHHADRGHRGRQRKGCRASARANSWIRSCSRRRRERIQQFSCRALATAARRPRTPSRSQALRRWKLTVLSLRPRMREVSQLVLPMAAQRRHWACRGDSGRAAGREPGAARAGAAGVSAGASAGRSAEPGRIAAWRLAPAGAGGWMMRTMFGRHPRKPQTFAPVRIAP